MKKRYKNGDGVEHINLDVYEGEFVTMLGPSGCGKSTILRTLGGFLDINEGEIIIDGKEVQNPSSRKSVRQPWYSRAIICGRICRSMRIWHLV